jgi:hypothetical protein
MAHGTSCSLSAQSQSKNIGDLCQDENARQLAKNNITAPLKQSTSICSRRQNRVAGSSRLCDDNLDYPLTTEEITGKRGSNGRQIRESSHSMNRSRKIRNSQIDYMIPRDDHRLKETSSRTMTTDRHDTHRPPGQSSSATTIIIRDDE